MAQTLYRNPSPYEHNLVHPNPSAPPLPPFPETSLPAARPVTGDRERGGDGQWAEAWPDAGAALQA